MKAISIMFHLAPLLLLGSSFASITAVAADELTGPADALLFGGDVVDVGTASNGMSSGLAATEGEASSGEIVIQDFANPTVKWETMTDQVMGGKSTSNMTIENGVAHLKGKCETVPFRNSPGFVSLRGGQHWHHWGGGDDEDDADKDEKKTFPDISHCEGLKLLVKSNVEYGGYHVDIGMPSRKVHGWGYKSEKLSVPKDEFGEISLPFNKFSINQGHHHWGQQNGATDTEDDNVCSTENTKACPGADTLCDMKSMSILGDGIVGDIDLEIKSIRAFGCSKGGADACLKKETPGGNNRSMEAQQDQGIWRKGALWFVAGSVLTLALGAYVLRREEAHRCGRNFMGATVGRFRYGSSWEVPAPPAAPPADEFNPAIPANQFA